MKSTKKLLTRIGAVIIAGVALASVATAADGSSARDQGASGISAAVNAASNISLPAVASETASRVRDAIAGGSSASVVASQRSDPASPGHAKAAGASLISAAQRLAAAGTAGTVGVRPGWGCGDKNHEHSGPPGRPDASPPPGCNR